MLSGSQTLRRGSGLIRPRNAAPLIFAADSRESPQASLRGGSAAAAARRRFSAAPLPKASALPSYVLNCPETQVTTLPNGLRVASEVGPDLFGAVYGISVVLLAVEWKRGPAITPPTRVCLPNLTSCKIMLLYMGRWRASLRGSKAFTLLHLTHA